MSVRARPARSASMWMRRRTAGIGIRNVCVERNVYLCPSAAMLEEEDLIILTMCSEQAASQQP